MTVDAEASATSTSGLPAGSGAARRGDVTLTLELTTPWESQSCRLELPGWQSPDLCAGLTPNQTAPRTVEAPVEALAGRDHVWVFVSRVRRDPKSGLGGESQRIGLKVTSLTISPAA